MYILFVARGPGCIYFNSKHQFYISIEIEETQWAQSTRSTALKMDIRYVMHRRVFWRDERKLALLTCACTFALRQQEGGYVQELCGFGGNIVWETLRENNWRRLLYSFTVLVQNFLSLAYYHPTTSFYWRIELAFKNTVMYCGLQRTYCSCWIVRLLFWQLFVSGDQSKMYSSCKSNLAKLPTGLHACPARWSSRCLTRSRCFNVIQQRQKETPAPTRVSWC